MIPLFISKTEEEEKRTTSVSYKTKTKQLPPGSKDQPQDAKGTRGKRKGKT